MASWVSPRWAPVPVTISVLDPLPGFLFSFLASCPRSLYPPVHSGICRIISSKTSYCSMTDSLGHLPPASTPTVRQFSSPQRGKNRWNILKSVVKREHQLNCYRKQGLHSFTRTWELLETGSEEMERLPLLSQDGGFQRAWQSLVAENLYFGESELMGIPP